MDEDLEKLIQKELDAREAAKKEQEEAERQRKQQEIAEANKKTNKIIIWSILAVVVIGIIIGLVIGLQPKDYEYKLTKYEVLALDDTKAIVDIQITNNTNTKKYCYVQIAVYDKDGLFITYSEAAFTPPPKSTDTYQMTVQSFGDSLYGTTVKITSFTPIG